MGKDLEFKVKLDVLKRIFKRGKEIWPTQSSLMHEALSVAPSSFDKLKFRHIDPIIAKGNSELVKRGIEPVEPKPEDYPGRCEDLWNDQIEDDFPEPCLGDPLDSPGDFSSRITIGNIEEEITLADIPEEAVPTEYIQWSDEPIDWECSLNNYGFVPNRDPSIEDESEPDL